MVIRKLFLILMMFISLLLMACSSNQEQSYQANTIQNVMVGTVESVEIVKVDGKSSWIGATSGSIAGGLLGTTLGNGWGRLATSIAGSVAGSLAGSGVERELTRGEGLKMSVRKENGSSFSVVFVPEQGQVFKVGDKVRVISNSSGAVQIDHQE